MQKKFAFNKDESARMVKSDFLEAFSKVRWFAPLIIYVPLIAFLFYFTAAEYMMPGAPDHFAFFAGFLPGYIAYDMMHYGTHHLTIRGKLMLYVKKHHIKHHYQDNTKGFNISMPIRDFMFRTNYKY